MPIKIPGSVVVLSIIQIVLGVLIIGGVLESQATGFSVPLYQSIAAYGLALIAAMGLAVLGMGLLNPLEKRAGAVLRALPITVWGLFVLGFGYSLVSQIATWTTNNSVLNQINNSFCSSPGGGVSGSGNTCTIPPVNGSLGIAGLVRPGVNANQVIASIVLDLGLGLGAALLAGIAWFLLRNRVEERSSGAATVALGEKI